MNKDKLYRMKKKQLGLIFVGSWVLPESVYKLKRIERIDSNKVINQLMDIKEPIK